jgi:Holliday junction resolvasome RuvABC DNA-binding subunit
MFDSIRGTVAAIENDEWILETDWYGFRIKVTPFISSGKIEEQKNCLFVFIFAKTVSFFTMDLKILKKEKPSI